MSRPGFSLAEVVLASFLMLVGLLAISALFQSGLGYERRAQGESQAALIAQAKLEELRAWSGTRTAGGYGFDDWSASAGTDQEDPDHPEYRVQVEVEAAALSDPCTALEEAVAPGNRKTLSASTRKIQVSVRWRDGPQEHRYDLVTLAAEPPRGLRASDPVVVTELDAIPALLDRDAPIRFTARAFDRDGAEIQDLAFRWYVKPGPGAGSLSQSRDGKVATFTNVVKLLGRPPRYTGHSAVLEVRTLYAGRELTATSAPIPLQP